jgi:hypothetical protein
MMNRHIGIEKIHASLLKFLGWFCQSMARVPMIAPIRVCWIIETGGAGLRVQVHRNRAIPLYEFSDYMFDFPGLRSSYVRDRTCVYGPFWGFYLGAMLSFGDDVYWVLLAIRAILWRMYLNLLWFLMSWNASIGCQVSFL